MSVHHSYLRFTEGADELAPARPSARRVAATIGTALLVLFAVPLFLVSTASADDGPSSTHAVREDDSGPSDTSGAGSEGDDDTEGDVKDTREGDTRGDRNSREGNTRGDDTTQRTREGNTRGTKNTRDEGPGQTTVDTREGNTRGDRGTHEGDTDGATTRGETQTRTRGDA
jgi:hypothetical protein